MTRRPNTKITSIAMALIATTLLAASCSPSATQEDAPESIVLLTHDSFALSDDVLETFTEQTGVKVVVTTAGDAGTMLNQAILTKDNPIADVIFGVDNSFISRAIDNELFTPHRATDIDAVDTAIRIEGDLATPITYGDVCINFAIDGVEASGVSVPTELSQFTDPAYEDLLVVEDPATSSPGLAFLLSTIATYPEGSSYDWKAYWTDLFANGVSVASDWSEAYYTQFSQAGGERPFVVSYASSPPAEVYFGDSPQAPTGSMTEGCFRQVEYAGVLAGTEYPTTAALLVDFLLSTTVQDDIPLTMFVFPTNRNAVLPEVFVTHTAFPDQPIIMDPKTIDESRERWIAEWTAIARS